MKLFSRKTNDPIQLLRWLKEILHYRTQFLKDHISEASQGTSCKILQQMYIMLETVLLLFLRNTNIDAVRVAMSCFKYLVLEAELVEQSVVPYTPNIGLYRQLDSLSTLPQIGRAAQQKKIRGILKGLVHTPGSALAWEDTYSSWRVTKALLTSFQRNRDDHSSSSLQLEFSKIDSFPRHFMRKTISSATAPSINKEQQLSEENLQAEMMNWTNMTGFLCSLAGVSTKASPSNYSLLLMNGGPNGDISNFIDGSHGEAGLHHVPNSVACLSGLEHGGGGGGPTSPVRDPNHIRVKRSSSYHGGRPKSMTQINPPHRTGSGTGGKEEEGRGRGLEGGREGRGQLRESDNNINLIYCTLYIAHHLHPSGSGRGSTSSDPNSDSDSRTSQTQSFVNELIQLLRCENEAVGVQLRETVKEMISYELSPPVYSYLFECMTEESSNVSGYFLLIVGILF